MALVRGSGFALPLPPGWQDRSVVTLVETPATGGSASIVVTRDPLPPGMSAAEYARLQESVLRGEAGDGLERLESSPARVAGAPALVRTYRWRLGESVMRQRIWFLIGAEGGVCITATAEDERFEALADTFRAAVDGFRLDEG